MHNQLSAADRSLLSDAQQKQILALKQAWADANAAGDTAGMAEANRLAEAIRAEAGYAGGSDGSGYTAIPAAGKSAQEVQQWVTDYESTHYDPDRGWVNGYSTAMNLRSMANYIRQQMQANSDAWSAADQAGRTYLHDQNKQLAQILEQAVGGAKSTYNEKLGRWETDNANLGYGYNVGQYNDPDWYKNAYGMTEEQMEAYRSDTDRYRNFVDQQVVRNWVDESSGFTGEYAQFADGPYGQLMSGTKGVDRSIYVNVQGDGFDDENEDYRIRDPQPPALKNNNTMSDYTKQFAPYVENGVIQPGKLKLPHGVASGGMVVEGGGSVQSGVDQSLLDVWQAAAKEQAVTAREHAVDQAVQQLLAAQAQTEGELQNRRDQIAREERNALDNAALYAEARGDRGGIGQAQYNRIQAQAAANRQTVSAAQTELAQQTRQEIIRLRAEGKFQTADDLLEIAQTYLLKLLDLEKWAAEYALDTAKFEDSVARWQLEYLTKAAQLLQ